MTITSPDHDENRQNRLLTSINGATKKKPSEAVKNVFDRFYNLKNTETMNNLPYFETPSILGFGQWNRKNHHIDETVREWPKY